MDVDQIDEWARARASKWTDWSSDFVMRGGDLNDPVFRKRLGEHAAFMELRSYISAGRKAEALRARLEADNG
jgi:hypothetical protein